MMNDKLFFVVDDWINVNLVNFIDKDLIVGIHVYKYHSNTNYPSGDLTLKYYYKYSHTLMFHQNGEIEKKNKKSLVKEVLMIVPDYRIMPDNEEDLIKMIKRKLNLDNIRINSITWLTEDFERRAEQLEGKNWKNIYDDNEFENALYDMIRKHDAELGITWTTIDYYLDTYCRKNEFEESE